MGTWASNNLGNDGACDFRDGIVEHILKTAVPPKDALEIDEIMAAIDILLAISHRCGASGRLSNFDTHGLQGKVLEVFDVDGPNYYPDPEYRKERRAVIARTFDELYFLQSEMQEPCSFVPVERDPDSMTETERAHHTTIMKIFDAVERRSNEPRDA